MKKLISIILIMVMFLGVASAMAEDRGEFYPLLAVVTAWNRVGDTDIRVITCTDRHGNNWEFYDDEDFWNIGDVCNLLMWNMGELEEADEIVEVYYETTLTALDTARFIFP